MGNLTFTISINLFILTILKYTFYKITFMSNTKLEICSTNIILTNLQQTFDFWTKPFLISYARLILDSGLCLVHFVSKCFYRVLLIISY